ncbi:MAG: flagellar motor switch protein FliN [Phycisphaerales bacterium]
MADEAPKSKNVPEAEAEAQMLAALNEAQSSLNQIKESTDTGDGSGLDEFIPGGPGAVPTGLEMLGDVDLHVMVELGRTEMLVEDVLKLVAGSVVELDKLAGDPVDVYVNQRLVARGEVLVLNDNFCIRISEIIANLQEEAQQAAQEPAQTV